ncbi:MAG: LysR family transcriptional regulator [Lachnospiraceae bacterium]|nr:LysR family transcriptional regulator [Lachnospiraceae bacterium]
MRDTQLELFISIADFVSFSKAEASHFISKQAILKQINSLEDEIGAKLFIRNSHGVALTKAGKEFYYGAKDMLKLRDATLLKCRTAANLPETIRIGQIEHQALLHNVTDQFMVKYPNIRIQKVVHPNHSGEFRVANNIIDISECFYHEMLTDVSYTRLTSLPYCAVMRKDHPLHNHTSVSLKNLTPYRTIVFEMMMNAEYMAELKKTFHFHADNLVIRRDVDNQVEAVFECTSNNDVFLSASYFVHLLPELKVIPLDNSWSQEFGIIFQPSPSAAVRKYIDFAVQMFQSGSALTETVS